MGAMVKYIFFIPAVLMTSAAHADTFAAPLGYFLHGFGPAARPNLILDWVDTGICVAVCVLIACLLLYAVLHKRQTDDDRAIMRRDGGLRWVFIATGISCGVLFAMGIYALMVLSQTAEPPTEPKLTITVTGYQWWWKVDYDNADPAKRFTTANEIHIPVGEPVRIELKSADVIHAFWVPLLAGKTQMIPGQVNSQWLQADRPGRYWGQCTQFCGVQHAHMAYEVVAQSPADFAAWEKEQRAPAALTFSSPLPEGRAGEGVQAMGFKDQLSEHPHPNPSPQGEGTEEEIRKGATIFLNQCAACHTIRGTDAAGGHAPDLTHLQSRRLLAAGLMTNTPEHLSDWIAHAQTLKPGARMPDFDLSPADKAALIAYLETLQ
jgi:cytochrome c oxidase subunit 2